MEWEMQDEDGVADRKPFDHEELSHEDSAFDAVMANVSFKLHLKE